MKRVSCELRNKGLQNINKPEEIEDILVQEFRRGIYRFASG